MIIDLFDNTSDYSIDINKSHKNLKYRDVINSIIPMSKIDELIQNYIDKNKQQYEGKQVSYDLLIENQRGFIIFGLPFFTKYLFPYDPANFTNIYGSQITNLKLFPTPDLNWEWIWDKWIVIMNDKDTDDQGWKYSWRFNSNHWTGEQNFGSCVRRRIWLRLREKV